MKRPIGKKPLGTKQPVLTRRKGKLPGDKRVSAYKRRIGLK